MPTVQECALRASRKALQHSRLISCTKSTHEAPGYVRKRRSSKCSNKRFQRQREFRWTPGLWISTANLWHRDGKYAIRGAIANVASMTGIRGYEGLPAYSATKHAIIGLSKSVCFTFHLCGGQKDVNKPRGCFTVRTRKDPDKCRVSWVGGTAIRMLRLSLINNIS